VSLQMFNATCISQQLLCFGAVEIYLMYLQIFKNPNKLCKTVQYYMHVFFGILSSILFLGMPLKHFSFVNVPRTKKGWEPLSQCSKLSDLMPRLQTLFSQAFLELTLVSQEITKVSSYRMQRNVENTCKNPI